MQIIQIYTDGSCHTQLKIGAWACILLVGDQTVILKGIEKETSHNRMELLAVLKGIEYIINENINYYKIEIYSDSQYVVDITSRKKKLISNNYHTKTGKPIQNSDLIQTLIQFIEKHNLLFIKVSAHQKATSTINYNREADKIVRKLVRNLVKDIRKH